MSPLPYVLRQGNDLRFARLIEHRLQLPALVGDERSAADAARWGITSVSTERRARQFRADVLQSSLSALRAARTEETITVAQFARALRHINMAADEWTTVGAWLSATERVNGWGTEPFPCLSFLYEEGRRLEAPDLHRRARTHDALASRLAPPTPDI